MLGGVHDARNDQNWKHCAKLRITTLDLIQGGKCRHELNRAQCAAWQVKNHCTYTHLKGQLEMALVC